MTQIPTPQTGMSDDSWQIITWGMGLNDPRFSRPGLHDQA